ncbi:MAG: hypothetical protein AAF653_10515 [Chloroflexota bacterium]
MTIIPLNNNWTVEYFEPNIDGFEMAPSVQEVERISEWNCSGRFADAGFYAYLQHRFDLEPAEMCVRYELQIENAPPTTKVYVNDNLIAESAGEILRLDITDYVSLDKNRLSLRVDCVADREHQFEAVYLVQIPCDMQS